MPVETATYIEDLNTANPVGASDPKSQGDDHLRLIKTVLKNTFPEATAAFNMTPVQANNWFISGTYTIPAATMTYTRTDAGSAGMRTIRKLDSVSPAAADVMFFDDIVGKNSIGSDVIYSRFLHRLADPTSTSEDGEVLLQTMKAGVLTTRIHATPTDILLDGAPLSGLITFPSGTKMLFVQTTAPAGWTKDTTHNDKALRVVSGAASSGGTVAFTTAFASKSVLGDVSPTALSVAQMPVHTHVASGTTSGHSASHTHSFSDSVSTSSAGSHAHNPNSGTSFFANFDGNLGTEPGSSMGAATATDSAGAHTHSVTVSGNTGGASVSHTHTFSDTTTSAGSGSTHDHTFTGTAINIDVQHVDVIIATKD